MSARISLEVKVGIGNLACALASLLVSDAATGVDIGVVAGVASGFRKRIKFSTPLPKLRLTRSMLFP